MPVLAMSAGKVTAIWGSAFVRLPDGSLKPLQVGDTVAGGARIVTEENGLVEISPIKGPSVVVKAPDAGVVIDKTIAGIEARELDQAPAAGLTGGAEGGLQPGLRVDRVAELSGAASSFNFDPSGRTTDALTGSPANQTTQSTSRPDSAESSATPSAVGSAISINDIVVNEGAGTATFTVTLDKPSSTAVNVSFATGGASDTASVGADYAKTLGTITFEPGQTSKTITVPIVNDNTYEGSERFVVTLSEAGNAVIAKGQGVGEILDDGRGTVPVGVTPDDDRPHVVAVSNPSVAEGADLDFIVQLSPPSVFAGDQQSQHVSAFDTPLSLKLSGLGDASLAAIVRDGGIEYSMDAGEHFLPLSMDAQGNLHNPDGTPLTLHAYSPTTPIIVKVHTVLNDVHDGPQSIELTASSPYDAAPVHGVGTIDDRPYMLVQSGEPAVEGHPVVFDVVLTHAIDSAVTVRLTLLPGIDDPNTPENESATPGIDTDTQLEYLSASGDWQLVTGDLTFEPGQTLMQVRVATGADGVPESTEFIKLQVDVVAGDTANHSQFNQTAIIDGHSEPYLLVHSGEPAVEGQPIVFDVVLTHALDQDLVVHLDLQPGVDYPDTPEHESAIPGLDTGTTLEYLDAEGEWQEVVNGTVTLAAGQTLIQVRVDTLNDNLAEDIEFIKLHAQVDQPGLTANTEHANQTALIDNPPYLLVQSGEPAQEGQPIVFDVVLTHAIDKAVNVALTLGSGIDDPDTTENESATLGVDTGTQLEYLDASSGQWQPLQDGREVTFHPGETLIQVRVATNADTQLEDTEYIKLQADVKDDSAALVANASQFNQTAIIDTSLLSSQYQAMAPATPSSAEALDLRDLLPTHDTASSASDLTHYLAFDANAANAQIVATLLNPNKLLADHA